jgi:myo-inositol-1(or 4)-monophosphatase
MHQPYLGETYMGTLQTASYRKKNNKIKTITARNTRHLKDAILYCTHPSLFASHDDLENFMAIADKCRMMRFGGDCYIYCMLAHGFIDLVIEAGLQPYDIIPLIPIIEAAGGIITDWEGKSAAAGGRIIASATPELHAEALQLLN